VEPDAELLGDDPVRLRRSRRDPEPPSENLPAAEPGPRSYLPLRILAVAVLVALVASTAWHADRQARAHESAALAACRQKLHNATVSADLTLVAVAHNLRPTLATTRGEKRARVERTMSNPARQVLPDVAEAARACRAVSVLPWHLALHGRHEATAAYSSALATKVQRIAADGREFYRDEPSLRRLRRAADIGVLGGRY
jgi:hypothetical protein